MTNTITQSLNKPAAGLWSAITREARFLRSQPGYVTEIDPRIPRHTTLSGNLTPWANSEVKVTDITIFPDTIIQARITAAAGALLTLPLTSISGIKEGYQLRSSNISAGTYATVTNIFENNTSALVSNVALGTVVAAGEVVSILPYTQIVQATVTVTADPVLATSITIPVDNISVLRVGYPVSVSNISPNANPTISAVWQNNNAVTITPIVENASTTAILVVAAADIIGYTPKGRLGALRIGEEVMLYSRSWSSNNSLTGITRNVGRVSNAVVTANIAAGNLVSSLGLRTVSS
jgi:hypothetical protein